MSEQPPEPTQPLTDESPDEPEWVRRRRLAAVFGDVLPDQTRDDRDESGPKPGKGDDWYREQVPPHHG